LTRRCTQNSCKKNDGVLRVAKKRKKGKERKTLLEKRGDQASPSLKSILLDEYLPLS
jgi:hypothetical protein